MVIIDIGGCVLFVIVFQTEAGIRVFYLSLGLGDVYKGQVCVCGGGVGVVCVCVCVCDCVCVCVCVCAVTYTYLTLLTIYSV